MIQDQVTVLYIYPPLLEWGGGGGGRPCGHMELGSPEG